MQQECSLNWVMQT